MMNENYKSYIEYNEEPFRKTVVYYRGYEGTIHELVTGYQELENKNEKLNEIIEEKDNEIKMLKDRLKRTILENEANERVVERERKIIDDVRSENIHLKYCLDRKDKLISELDFKVNAIGNENDNLRALDLIHRKEICKLVNRVSRLNERNTTLVIKNSSLYLKVLGLKEIVNDLLEVR